jgi:hypothetical protein
MRVVWPSSLFLSALFLCQVAGAQTAGIELSGFPYEKYRLLFEDMEFLERIELVHRTPLYASLIGESSPRHLMRKVSRWVSRFSYSQTLAGYFLAIADRSGNESPERGQVFLYPLLFSHNVPMIKRVSTLVHEARHFELPYSRTHHAACPARSVNGTPLISLATFQSLEGKHGCDHSGVGAYGTEYVFLTNIAMFCESSSSEVRRVAGDEAEIIIHRIVDRDEQRRLLDDKLISGSIQ